MDTPSIPHHSSSSLWKCLLVVLLLQLCWSTHEEGVGVSVAAAGVTCDYTIRPTGRGGGLGLFATRDLPMNHALEIGIGIPFPLPVLYWNELLNYAEGFNETHALLPLGNGILLNHHVYRSEVNVVKLPSAYPSQREESVDVIYEYTQDIAEGSQLLVDYGEGWFEDRNMQALDMLETLREGSSSGDSPLEKEAIIDLPGNSGLPCLTDRIPTCPHEMTRLSKSELYARVDIPQGTVIEISRAILFPVSRALLKAGLLEGLVWWLTSPDALRSFHSPEYGFLEHFQKSSSPYVIAPLNQSIPYAMIMSGRGPFYTNGGSLTEGNVGFEWFDWTTSSSSSSSNISCQNLMTIAIRSNRNIKTGEKLVVSFERGSLDSSRRFLGSDLLSKCSL